LRPAPCPCSRKRFRLGTHRVLPPDQTLNWLAPKLAPLGITRVANITGLDYIGIPVAMAVRPGSRSLSVAQGKGATIAAAKVSAVMEAAELHSAERPPNPVVWRASAHFAAPEAFAAPRHLRLRRLPRDAPIGWIAGRNLIDSAEIFVPEELVTLDLALPEPAGRGYFLAGSNGLAAGNTLAEATLHALCETVERDALSLWRQSPPERRAATRIDPEGIDDATVIDFLARYRGANIAVTVWDVTSDVGVPCFFCIVDDAEGRGPFLGPCAGSGCHPAVGVALSRALAEAAQSRLTFIVGAREDIPRESYAAVGWHENFLRVLDEDETVLEGADAVAPRARSCDGATIDADIDTVLARLAAAGMTKAIRIDLTDPLIDVPSVRVIVPGLEGMHHKPGYKPGARARRMTWRCA